MKEYRGNIRVTQTNEKDWAKKLENVEFVTGGVHIDQGATLTAPVLAEVTGGVHIDQGATLTAPVLAKTGGVQIDQRATLTAPVLAEVTGGVHIDQGATLTAPVLAKTGGVHIDQGATLTAPVLAEVTGWVHIDQGATLTAPVLAKTGGVHIDATLSPETEKALWEAAKGNSWTMTENASDWMLSQQGNIKYKISNVQFDKGLFFKVRNGELTAAEVFALPNMEQRRAAYEKLDKIKMKDLDGLEVLDEVADDGCGFPMRIVSFKLPGIREPFRFLNCHCPSSGREYFIERAGARKCWEAKAASFGLPADVVWVAEY